jgi:HD-like signal output (HDOD) protein
MKDGTTIYLSTRVSTAMELPTLPEIVLHLGEAIDSPEAGAADVGDLIAKDPTLTAKILRAANSVLYGRSERCWSPREACAVLGLRSVRNIVVGAVLLERYEHLKASGYDVSVLWRDAPLVGLCASMLARCIRPPLGPRPDEAYLAGLLHDIGQLVLLDHVGDLYLTIQSAASCGLEPLEEYETRELGYTHAEIGALVVEAWGCGEQVHDAVLQHHSPISAAMPPLTAVVAVADKIVERLNENKFTAAVDAVGSEILKALGLSRGQVSDIVEVVYAQLHGSRDESKGIRAPLPSSHREPPPDRPRAA